MFQVTDKYKDGQPEQAMGEFALDAGIAPVVEALSACGVLTCASCEGHVSDPLPRAYVLFWGGRAAGAVTTHYLTHRHWLYLPWRVERAMYSSRLRYSLTLDLWRVKGALFFLPEKFAWAVIKYLQKKDVQMLSKLTFKASNFAGAKL